MNRLNLAFKPCSLGLYPVVDSSRWLEMLLPIGVKCIQLRLKNKSLTELETEIAASVLIAKTHGATLFINDYWELAIHLGADGVHLGQEDLTTADIQMIHRAGLYLGISTHCEEEVAIAQALQPSYLACGPIFPTTSKIMRFAPQGIAKLRYWRSQLNYPLVAIGGITLERLPEVLSTGVEGIALISGITQSPDPVRTTQQFLKQIKEARDGRPSRA